MTLSLIFLFSPKLETMSCFRQAELKNLQADEFTSTWRFFLNKEL